MFRRFREFFGNRSNQQKKEQASRVKPGQGMSDHEQRHRVQADQTNEGAYTQAVIEQQRELSGNTNYEVRATQERENANRAYRQAQEQRIQQAAEKKAMNEQFALEQERLSQATGTEKGYISRVINDLNQEPNLSAKMREKRFLQALVDYQVEQQIRTTHDLNPLPPDGAPAQAVPEAEVISLDSRRPTKEQEDREQKAA